MRKGNRLGLIITTPLVNMVESLADYINAKHTVGWNIIIAMLAIVLR
jgi:hypothetical protein